MINPQRLQQNQQRQQNQFLLQQMQQGLPTLNANLQPQLLAPSSKPKSIIFRNLILVFGAQKEITKAQDVSVYNLENQEWTTITPNGDLALDLTNDYSVCLLNNESVVLYGRASTRAVQNNLPQADAIGLGNLMIQPAMQACCQILTLTEPSSIQITGVSDLLQGQYGPAKIFNSSNLPYMMFAAINAHNQKLYICGGTYGIGNPSSDLYIVDCSNGEFKVSTLQPKQRSSLEFMLTIPARSNHIGVVYKDKIYYYGGTDGNFNSLFDMWSLNLNSLVWEQIQLKTLRPDMKTICQARIAGDTIFVLGCATYINTLEEDCEVLTYKIDNNTWATVNAKIKASTHNIFEVYQNKILFGEPLQLSSVSLGDSHSQGGVSDTNFRASDRKLFVEKPFADITFNVEGQQILAHKALLATRSQHFSNMFQSGMKESTSTVIDIPDTTATIFSGFLEYLYCGNIQNLKEDVATELLKFADKYSVSGLREYCEQFLINKLKVGNVISLTNLAEFCSADKLEKAGISFLAQNFEMIFKEQDIKQLSSSILFEVFRFVKEQGPR